MTDEMEGVMTREALEALVGDADAAPEALLAAFLAWRPPPSDAGWLDRFLVWPAPQEWADLVAHPNFPAERLGSAVARVVEVEPDARRRIYVSASPERLAIIAFDGCPRVRRDVAMMIGHGGLSIDVELEYAVALLDEAERRGLPIPHDDDAAIDLSSTVEMVIDMAKADARGGRSAHEWIELRRRLMEFRSRPS
jgi:hypothetical protein